MNKNSNKVMMIEIASCVSQKRIDIFPKKRVSCEVLKSDLPTRKFYLLRNQITTCNLVFQETY